MKDELQNAVRFFYYPPKTFVKNLLYRFRFYQIERPIYSIFRPNEKKSNFLCKIY